MIKDRNKFVEFLIRAKKNTYAGDGDTAEPSRPTSKDLYYQEGELLYIDTYLGDLDFIGEEAVWQDDKPLWGMNYYGRMLVEEIPAEFSKCLKDALKNAPEEAPFRGPKYYQHEDCEYYCSWQGELGFFSGEEYIEYKGKKVYELSFHGGTIR